MDLRPIGLFDSGIGGLSCVPHMIEALPHERIVYFGDTARFPFGSKAAPVISSYATEITEFLINSHDVKMIAIACNTVSAIALDELRQKFPQIPIIGIVDPSADAVAKTCTPNNRIGVIATKATVASEVYTKTISRLSPELVVYMKACQALVPLIEEGIIYDNIIDPIIGHYMDGFIESNNIDTLLLGCTHYSFIRKNIERLYPGLRIIDSSKQMLEGIKGVIEAYGLQSCERGADHAFYASDLSGNFTDFVDRLFSGTDHPYTLGSVFFGGN